MAARARVENKREFGQPRPHMIYLRLVKGGALAVTLCIPTMGAQADEQSRYPDWRAQWVRVDAGYGPQFDPSKPAGRGQQAPLTAEYQAIFEANLANLAAGTQPYNTQLNCLPP